VLAFGAVVMVAGGFDDGSTRPAFGGSVDEHAETIRNTSAATCFTTK